MAAYIHSLATRVPLCVYTQEFARDRMMSWMADSRGRRLVKYVYDRSGIEKRHSVLRDFMPGAEPELFRAGIDGVLLEPSTRARNRVYIREARRLCVGAARAALEQCPGLEAGDITHVITVSCTGFYNPGPDYDVVSELGLSAQVERYHLGFMGCYAAFPALRMAKQFCEANPAAAVLIVCVELCSLHLQVRGDTDSLLGNALFADGAASAVVSARVPEEPSLVLKTFQSSLATEGKEAMAWEIGDRGFDLILSSYVPDIIAGNIGGIVAGLGLESVNHWAMHPGGKAILDKVEDALGLGARALEHSRGVLRDFGNMSSATILFVLERLLNEAVLQDGESIAALAFGPGLTIESAVLEVAGNRSPVLRAASDARRRFFPVNRR